MHYYNQHFFNVKIEIMYFLQMFSGHQVWISMSRLYMKDYDSHATHVEKHFPGREHSTGTWRFTPPSARTSAPTRPVIRTSLRRVPWRITSTSTPTTNHFHVLYVINHSIERVPSTVTWIFMLGSGHLSVIIVRRLILLKICSRDILQLMPWCPKCSTPLLLLLEENCWAHHF